MNTNTRRDFAIKLTDELRIFIRATVAECVSPGTVSSDKAQEAAISFQDALFDYVERRIDENNAYQQNNHQ